MEITIQVAKEVQDLLPNMEIESQEIIKNNGVAVQAVLRYIVNYEKARKLLSLRLINKKMNAGRLMDTPYKNFLDMAVVAVMIFPSNGDVTLSSTVNKQLLDIWKVSFDDVYEDASANFMGEKTVIKDMCKILSEIEFYGFPWKTDVPMYVLTNESGVNGATHLLKSDVLGKFAADRKTDILVLPSSVHEAILVPYQNDLDIEEISQIVQVVNREEVSIEDILSDHAYLYRLSGGWAD